MEFKGVNNHAILIAYEKGYRVTEDGRLLNPKGQQLKPLMAKGRKYPIFNVLDGKKKHYLRIHRFAAYCFYGEEMFKDKLLVRHLNSNVMDFSKVNLALGTQTDNVNDMPDETKQKLNQKKREWCLRTGKVPPPQHKWTELDIKLVLVMLEEGYSTRQIGKKLGIPHNSVWAIKKREMKKRCK